MCGMCRLVLCISCFQNGGSGGLQEVLKGRVAHSLSLEEIIPGQGKIAPFAQDIKGPGCRLGGASAERTAAARTPGSTLSQRSPEAFPGAATLSRCCRDRYQTGCPAHCSETLPLNKNNRPGFEFQNAGGECVKASGSPEMFLRGAGAGRQRPLYGRDFSMPPVMISLIKVSTSTGSREEPESLLRTRKASWRDLLFW
jgi:hypothetical protein